MNYGLYVSAAGVMTNLYRQDVFANNLANVNTTAFKPDIPELSQRDPEAVEDNLGMDVSNRLLERLGGGVYAGPQRIDMSTAQLTETGNPLDVALQKDGQFFAVQVTDPKTGQVQVRLTRDGRFTRNDAGELVNTAGHRVLDPNDQPIRVRGSAPVRIDGAGHLLQNGKPVAQLQVAQVNDTGQLEKRGGGSVRLQRQRHARDGGQPCRASRLCRSQWRRSDHRTDAADLRHQERGQQCPDDAPPGQPHEQSSQRAGPCGVNGFRCLTPRRQGAETPGKQ